MILVFFLYLFTKGHCDTSRSSTVARDIIEFGNYAPNSSPAGWTRCWWANIGGASTIEVVGSDSEPTDWHAPVEVVSVALPMGSRDGRKRTHVTLK